MLSFRAKVTEAIKVLSDLLTSERAAFASETVIFNVATIQELRTEAAVARKVDLLRGALQYSGEGLSGACFKLAA